MTVFLYAFREREDLMDCYEAVSGTRMHATYYRPGGVYRDLPERMPQHQPSTLRSAKDIDRLNDNRQGSLLDFIEDFARRFPTYVDEYETLLTDNRIWKQRTVGIGVVSPERALQLGFSGAMLRGSGIAWICARNSPTKSMTGWIRYPGRHPWRLLRSLSGAHGRNAPVQPHHQQCVDWLRANNGPVMIAITKSRRHRARK